MGLPKGFRHTKKSRKKISESGKKRQPISEATRKKMSETRKKMFAEGKIRKMTGKNHPMYGIKHSAADRKKISEKVRQAYANGKQPWNKGKTNVYSKEQLENISSSTKKAMARKDVQKNLKKAGKLFKKGTKPWNTGTKGMMPDPWNKGRKATEAERKKFSIAQKKYYKEHPEQIEIMRKVNLGRKHTAEARKSMSIAQQRLAKTKFTPEYRKKLSLARQGFKTPKIDTKPEKAMQKLLRDSKIKFDTHKKMLGQPDVFIKPDICIFVDGDRFHANPKKYADDVIIWNEYNRKGRHVPAQTAKMIRAKDMRINRQLKKEGFKVLRFWQTEFESDPQKCLNKILKKIKS
ncbi:NUMOD3 domain-containing DNA-binding protein [Candidatus Nitrosopelagicus sp.]|nr:NUMOD3 domain-containing DNA-binding protein [Candidatus Nitrosopelagicus sp.]